jgi:hypothetical protein
LKRKDYGKKKEGGHFSSIDSDKMEMMLEEGKEVVYR